MSVTQKEKERCKKMRELIMTIIDEEDIELLMRLKNNE